MKISTNHSSHHRKCFECGKKTGDALVIAESDIEIRIPVCDVCALNFKSDADLERIKPAFSVIKTALK